MAAKPDNGSIEGFSEELDIAIVGGGIAGLYCALKCDRTRFQKMRLFKATHALGGRISTKRYPEEGPREFDAEFGPMRIEPDQQPLLAKLLDDLGIREKRAEFDQKTDPDSTTLVPFPAYASPADTREPRYELSGEEHEQKTPLDLLKLAFVRLIGRLVADAGVGAGAMRQAERDALDRCLESGRRALILAVASRQREWKGSFQGWINKHREEDYQNIREYAAIEYDDGDRIPLWQMGFWKLISDVLSHEAVTKLRDQGAFYHLIPENPNAVEWLVFWLRGLKSSDKLQGIEGGMHAITERLGKKLPADVAKKNQKLICVRPHKDGERTILSFCDEESKTLYEVTARHVILTLPKSPLQKVVAQSGFAFSDAIKTDIGRCWGFPMTKVFAIVKKRWWEEQHRANYFAGRVPTRELHYWKSRRADSTRGMIMFYSDRPGSNFWANYLRKPGEQAGPDWLPVPAKLFDGQSDETLAQNGSGTGASDESAPALEQSQTRRLVYKLVEYLRDTGADALHPSDIEFYGIRDWGREPYGAANHTWLPETRAWIVLRHLSGFGLQGAPPSSANIHVCGEAYSNYQGFIEGSLRSAAHVLHQIHGAPVFAQVEGRDEAGKPPTSAATPTPWLCTLQDCACRHDDLRQKGWRLK